VSRIRCWWACLTATALSLTKLVGEERIPAPEAARWPPGAWWILTDGPAHGPLPQAGAGFGKLHHKLMVFEETTTIAGSFNYTAPANEYNDESIFVMGSPYVDLPRRDGGPVDPPVSADW